MMKSRDQDQQCETEELIEGYLNRIAQARLLTSHQQWELAQRAQAGDERARNLLIERNLRLVVSIVKKY